MCEFYGFINWFLMRWHKFSRRTGEKRRIINDKTSLGILNGSIFVESRLSGFVSLFALKSRLWCLDIKKKSFFRIVKSFANSDYLLWVQSRVDFKRCRFRLKEILWVDLSTPKQILESSKFKNFDWLALTWCFILRKVVNCSTLLCYE